MRELIEHKTNACNEAITIIALGDYGNADCHHYRMVIDPPSGVKSGMGCFEQDLFFQNGPILEEGPNGITNEVLLAIVADRLRCFQSGKFACAENANAVDHVHAAMKWLKSRTHRRVAEGVEGTHNP